MCRKIDQNTGFLFFSILLVYSKGKKKRRYEIALGLCLVIFTDLMGESSASIILSTGTAINRFGILPLYNYISVTKTSQK